MFTSLKAKSSVRHWTLPVAAVWTAITCAGCDSSDSSSLPTHTAEEYQYVLTNGVLGGNERCLWIDLHDGSRAALVMPSGTAVDTRGDRIVLVVDGNEIAAEGQWVAVGGGAGATPDCASDADFAVVVGEVSVCEVQAAICESEEE